MSPTLDDPNRKCKPPINKRDQSLEITIPFKPHLAAQIGLNESLLLTQLIFWINNLGDKVEEIDGVEWLNLSYEKLETLGIPLIEEESNTTPKQFSVSNRRRALLSLANRIQKEQKNNDQSSTSAHADLIDY